MGSFDNVSVYERLGVRPLINAGGTGTVVGGSGPPKIVREKMEEASRSFTDMEELLTKSGAFVADLMGVEAAFIYILDEGDAAKVASRLAEALAS